MENGSMEKKNIGLIISIVVLLLVLFGLGGYIIYDNFLNKDNEAADEEKTNNETDDFVKKVDEGESWIYDAKYNYEVSQNSYETAYSTYNVNNIIVPYINIKSNDAEAANLEIKNVFDDALKAYKVGVLDKTTYVDKCSYKSSLINDKALSVLLTFGVGSTDVVKSKYYTYNFDLKTGKTLTYEDTYKLAGLNSTNIDNKVKNEITTIVAEKIKSNLSTDELKQYTDASIANYTKSVTDNTIQYYLDSNNKLNIVVTLNIPVGAGSIDTVILVK